MGGAECHTSRLHTRIHPIHAIIALYHLADIGVPLRCSPRAGRHTAFASHAKGRVRKHDPITWPLLHGSRGASGDTPGIFAMKTRHEYIRSLWDAIDELGSDRDDVGRFRAAQEALVALARDGTAVTPDALLLILIQIVYAHFFPPFLGKGALTKGALLRRRYYGRPGSHRSYQRHFLPIHCRPRLCQRSGLPSPPDGQIHGA